VIAVCLAASPALARRDAAWLNAQFAAMDGSGWTGADAAWSAQLRDGREVWMFGDTFLGGVDAAGRRDPDTPMVRNSMLVSDRQGVLRTKTGHSAAGPTSLIPGSGPDDWYWPGPPVVCHRTLSVPMAHIVRTGPGGWDFRADGTALVRFGLRDLRPQAVTPIATPRGVNMASASVTAGRFTYVYGTRGDGDGIKEAFVARMPARRLRAQWSYWTGSRWSKNPTQAAVIARGVSDQFSVVHVRRRWVLISQVPMSREIDEFTASSPVGPWMGRHRIAATPQIAHAITYNAIVHPEYSHGRTEVVGYSVNAAEPNWVYTDAALYRPRFMTVRL
jgi:hypothetical protein